MPNGWRTINSLVHKIRLHGRRGKGMAESLSRQKSRHAPQKEGGLKILCDLPPVWPRLVRPTNLMSRMDGKKTHTHFLSRAWRFIWFIVYSTVVALSVFLFPCLLDAATYVCRLWAVSTFNRVWITQVRLPILLLVVSWTGKICFPMSPFAP